MSAPREVGPSATHPLAGVDRDAGISVELRDGSTLWLFGDTAHRRADESLDYFVIGTAAWAPSGQPTGTRDHERAGEPVAFATPTPDSPPCPAEVPVAGMWPSAAVVQPVGDRDRVVVWLENVCLGDGGRSTGLGMAVAEWWYDPAEPPDGRPIRATILNQRLFPRRGFGMAAVQDGAGRTFVYACGAPEGGGWPVEYGPCQVARIDLDRVATPTAYRVWDGSGWTPIADALAARLSLPDDSTVAPYPAAGFSVAFDPFLERYVMVYSPWPVQSTSIDVRVAERPEGPWSAPAHVRLPECAEDYGGAPQYCYAATAQPAFSSPGRLGLGYYDRLVEGHPQRGSYLVTTVAYEAS